MAENHKFEEFADSITSGLKDDAELRLDVCEEIKTHLQESQEAFQAEGKSKDESRELAIKSFGPAASIGEDLINANRKRMKLRHLLKQVLRFAIVPASVVLAIYLCFLSRFPVIRSIATQKLSESEIFDIFKPAVSPGAAFLIYGDTSKAGKTEQQKAIWDSEPSNKVYHGNYITELISNGEIPFSSDKMRKELRKAEEYEPENARYNYLLAASMLNEAIKEIHIDKKDKKGKRIREVQYQIKNRKLLDQAMDELLKATKKPYYKTYTLEMLNTRLNALPPSKHIEDAIFKMAISAGALLPSLNHFRTVARIIPFYAEKLAEEGHKERAKQLLECRYKIMKDMEANSFTLIEVLVIKAIAAMHERYAEAYRKLGEPELARETLEKGKILQEPVDKRFPKDENNRRIETAEEKQFERELRKRGSILDAMLLPALGPGAITPIENFSFGRELEYIIVERMGMSVLITLFMFMMLFCGIMTLYYYFRTGKKAPLLLLPDLKETSKILSIGVLLPVAVYFFYSRYTYLSHREFSLAYNGFRVMAEMLLLTVTIIHITTSPAKRWILERCISLGIEENVKIKQKRKVLNYILLGILWIICIILPKTWSWMPVALCGIGLFVLFRLLSSLINYLRQKPALSGAIVRSLIPVFSFSIILLCAVIPFLEMRERYLVRNNPTIKTDTEIPSFTNAESELVKRIRADYKEAFRKAGI